MKKILTIGLFTLSTLSFASHFGTYDKAGSELATDILNTCPVEAAKILKQHPRNRVIGGDYIGGMSPFSGISTDYHFVIEVYDKNNIASFKTLIAHESIKSEEDITIDCKIVAGKKLSRD